VRLHSDQRRLSVWYFGIVAIIDGFGRKQAFYFYTVGLYSTTQCIKFSS